MLALCERGEEAGLRVNEGRREEAMSLSLSVNKDCYCEGEGSRAKGGRKMTEGSENNSYTEEEKLRPYRLVDIHGNGEQPFGAKNLTLYDVINRFLAGIFCPDPESRRSFFHRIKRSAEANADDCREALKGFVDSVVAWTRRGGSWRGILVVSIGAVAAVGLTGLLAFVLFFSAATFNAVVISLLMSLAAAGGFLALFLVSVTGIYVGALFLAVCAISTITFLTMVAVLVTTGWIGFLWAVWQAVRKSFDVTKYSLTTTGSLISAYTSARYAAHHK